MRNLLVAALLASAIAAPACASELVVNGGFEAPQGLNSGWSYTVSDTQYVLINPPVAHSGDASLVMRAEADYASDFIYQTLDTVAGQIYDYSFWVSNGTGDGEAAASFFASIGSQVVANFGAAPSFNFMEFSGSFLATSNATEIYFEAYNTLGLYQLDDVSVRSRPAVDCDSRIACTGGGGVPEPATWAMMLLGFGGIGAMLRRRPRPQAA